MSDGDHVELARRRVRALMAAELDLAFRRRCETILEWLDPLPGETVLDCGCGYGFTLHVLRQLSEANLIGLDLEHPRLLHARDHLAQPVSFLRASAGSLPFAAGALPKAVCSEVLEHLPDDRAAVRELHRVLAPGGLLAVTVPSANYPFGWDPFNWMLEHLGLPPVRGERLFSGIWYGHRRLYTASTLANLLRGAGFEIVDERGLTHWVPPASHLVMYGILKPLLLRGVVPSRLRRAGDRMQAAPAPPKALTPVLGPINALDRLNDDPKRTTRVDSFVAIAALARKPT